MILDFSFLTFTLPAIGKDIARFEDLLTTLPLKDLGINNVIFNLFRHFMFSRIIFAILVWHTVHCFAFRSVLDDGWTVDLSSEEKRNYISED